jgi:apolipoprotein N-acyltransferase
VIEALKRVPWWAHAILSGVLVGLSQPILIESITGRKPLDPSGITGLLALVGLVPALVAIEGHGPKRAYQVGFVTWLVAFSIVIHWIVTTVHVYGGLPLWVALPTLFLLTSALAAYAAASFAVTRVIVNVFGFSQWLVLPAALTGVELLRNFGPLGGFPWGSIGHAFATVDVLRQGASLFGLTGLTFIAGLSNAAVASALSSMLRGERVRGRPLAVAGGVLALLLVYGLVRLQHTPAGPSVRVALLQPNVNEGLADLTREPSKSKLERFWMLETEALAKGAELVVWPEGSFPNRGLPRDLPSLAGVGVVEPDGQVPKATVLGAVSVGRIKDENGKTRSLHHNSAFVLDSELAVKGRFDKTHLVPFGEYVPWPFGGVVKQFIPLGTTTPGTSLDPIPVTVDEHQLLIGPTVCYEGIFPEISRTLAKNGATFFANLTDDRWYGVSGMATQHLLMYALRATETGRPVARATNTGISAWFDSRGRIFGATEMYTEALVVADVPLETTDTLYLWLGDWLAFLSLLFTLGAWFVAMLGTDVRKRGHSLVVKVLATLGAVFIALGFGLWLSMSVPDEARSTQAMLLVLAGLLVSIGALSGRPWGRRAPQVVGVIAALGALPAVVLASPLYAILVILGVGLVVLGRKLTVTRPIGTGALPA